MRRSLDKIPEVGYLHLTLRLISGGRMQFLQSDPDAAQRILETMQPDRVFAQKPILLTSGESMTIIPTDTIERIDVRSEPLPDWRHPLGITVVEEIAEDAFARIQRREPPPPPRPGAAPPVPAEIGVAVELRSGNIVYLSVRPDLSTEDDALARPERTPDDTRILLEHLFERPVLFGRSEGEDAFFLINPANAVRFTLAPGIAESVGGAWPMDIVA